MYSSDSDYRFHRAKAEQEAHRAQRQAVLPAEDSSVPAAASPLDSAGRGGGLRGFLSRFREDDLLILALLFLILNESEEDDPLILIVLAALLFS